MSNCMYTAVHKVQSAKIWNKGYQGPQSSLYRKLQQGWDVLLSISIHSWLLTTINAIQHTHLDYCDLTCMLFLADTIKIFPRKIMFQSDHPSSPISSWSLDQSWRLSAPAPTLEKTIPFAETIWFLDQCPGTSVSRPHWPLLIVVCAGDD